jgi:hypothetical protein
MWWDDVATRLRKKQGARLREARILRGFKTAADAQRRYNWPSTYVSHENGTRGIGRMYKEYAKKFRVNAAWLLGDSEERDLLTKGVKVVGEGALEVWRGPSASGGEVTAQETLSIPRVGGEDLDDRFAIRVADASINRSIPQGAYAICDHVDDEPAPAEFEVGQILYVERLRGDLRELSFRRVAHVSDKALRLTTHSVDPKLKQEQAYPSSREDEKLRIVGRVIGKYEELTT